jgi:hypothetical protein
MKKKIIYFVVTLFIFLGGIYIGVNVGLFFEWNQNEYYDRDGLWPMLSTEDTNYIPDDGFVPDEKTAIKIAKSVWIPIYGAKHLIVSKYKYRVRLVDDKIWVIEGVSRWGKHGGGPFIKIDKERSTILEISHTY